MDRTRSSRSLVPAAIFGCFLALTTGPTLADGSGAELYSEHCASCHGRGLEGQPDWQTPTADGTLPAPPHDNSGHTWHHGDRLLFDYTKLGGAEALRMRGATEFRSGMPAFGEILSDDEIRTILGFVKSHWGERERTYQETITAQE